MERWIITGKGAVNQAIIEVNEGRVSHAPDVLEHWFGKDWGWCRDAIERYGWTVEPLIEFTLDIPLGTDLGWY